MSQYSARYPLALKKGATIGVISPASAVKDFKILEKGKQLLEQQGFKVVIHPQNFLTWGQLAGDDKSRAQAIMDMFADPNIDAIVCARGGNGSIRLLKLLDYDVIASNPKPFVGFSDITVLLHAFRSCSDLVTYHGPMVSSNFGNDFDPQTLKDFLNVLEHAGTETSLAFPSVEILTPGTSEGILIGGNITLLQSISHSPYGWTGEKSILFLEDVDEVLYRVDRSLRHLKLSGLLKNVVAVLVGEMINLPDTETSFMRRGERPYGPDFAQILKDIFPDIPLAINIPCGHGDYMTTFPVGAPARVTLDGNGAQLTLLSPSNG